MMVQENEAIMLLLGVGILIFALANRARLKHLPSSGLLLTGFCVLLLGWALTVLEALLWGEALNVVEHLCYTGSAVLVLVWVCRAFGHRGDKP
jgi:hypothetical protein